MSFDERAANPCIGTERADLVLAGCAILEAIRRAFPSNRLRIADRGLREGILMQLMSEDGVWGGHAGAGQCERGRGVPTGPGRPLAEAAGQDLQEAHDLVRTAGWSASSTIPMSRGPSAKAGAPAPRSSSLEMDDKYKLLSPARAWSTSARRRAAGRRWRPSEGGLQGRARAV